MQTNFTLAQLADPDIAVSEEILRSCVHCGFCTATCPTYVELGDELDSPRGRIYLIKDMLEDARPANDEVTLHIDRCLSCFACMTTCPSGVDYMHLVDHARAYIEDTYERPWIDRTIRSVLAAILPYPGRFRAALTLAKIGKPFRWLVSVFPGGKRLAAMLDLAPWKLPAGSPAQRPGVFRAEDPRRGRVALLRGCAQSVLDPGINEAAIRLLNRAGIEVVLTAEEGCCGAIVHHMGRADQSHGLAKRNIDAWTREIDGEGLDAILVTTSGCGTSLKDYGFIFRNDPIYGDKAATVSRLSKDVSEYLEAIELGAPKLKPTMTVAYHAACSLQHGQQIKTTPKALLARAGFAVREPNEAHICCGSAGTYNMLQPEISARLKARKAKHILATGADVVTAGNIGCLVQIGSAIDKPVLHIVELLDWVYGGPKPRQLPA